MNTARWIQKALGVALATSLLAGCAQESSSGGSQSGTDTSTTATPTPTPTDNNPLNNEAGATADFQFVNIATLNTYVQTRPVNNPVNMKINVQLSDIGDGRYAGTVKLAYYDNGNYYVGIFDSGTSTIQKDQTYKNYYFLMNDAQFNKWFTWEGAQAFHGFFQDKLGAIVLVIDGGVDLGDGGGYSEVSGSVYFKNFSVAPAAQSSTKCWFHFSPSPYSCGTFFLLGLDNGSSPVVTTSALYPTNGYVKLGDFQGLNKVKAFGQ